MTMECSEIDELSFDYVEGRLAEPARDQVGGHLEACASCRHELELYRRTALVLDHVHQPAMPDSFWLSQARRIMDAVKPAVVWEAPPLSLQVLLVLPFAYMLMGIEGLGSTSSGFVRGAVEA